MNDLKYSIIASIILTPTNLYAQTVSQTNKLESAGYVENTLIIEKNIFFQSKLDTGAKTSSINAQDYRIFNSNGKDWVEFEITNRKGKKIRFSQPIVRQTRIRRAGTATKIRPVIELEICVVGHKAMAEFTLADRDRLDYQLLIGRSFLQNRLLVDSGKTYLGAKKCQ